MTMQELSQLWDSQDRPLEAVWAYELLLQESEASLETFLNLAVLYFVCTDFGYSAHHHLQPEFSSKAYERSLHILDLAEEKFGGHAEITFWKLYFNYVVLGAPPFREECERLVTSNESLIPYFYLYAYVDSDMYKMQANQLLKKVQAGQTARERYVKSVLEGVRTRTQKRVP